MKHFAFLAAITLAAGLGSLIHPFWAVLLYYTLSVLRPQFLWEWSLPMEVRWSLIAAMLVFATLLLNLHRFLTRAWLNPIVGLLLAFGTLLLLGVLTAYKPNIAMSYGTEYAKILLMAVLACMLINQVWQVKTIGFMLFAVLGYSAWEINSLYFFQSGRLDVFHHGFAGLDNNGAGLMLAMGLPFAYAVAFQKWQGWRKWLPLAALPVGVAMLHAVMMTYSRGAMLACAVGIGWVLMRHRPRHQTFGLAIALVLVLPVLAGPEIRAEFLSTRNFQEDASAQARFDSWSAAWTIATEHPLLGMGIRNSGLYSAAYGADIRGRTIHNQYLQIAADSGIPAAAAYLAMLCIALFNFNKTQAYCRSARARMSPLEENYTKSLNLERWLLGFEGCLVTFGFGALFLSLEVFELPWLLFVVGGVAPRAVMGVFDRVKKTDAEHADHANIPSLPTRPRLHPGHETTKDAPSSPAESQDAAPRPLLTPEPLPTPLLPVGQQLIQRNMPPHIPPSSTTTPPPPPPSSMLPGGPGATT